MGSPDHAFVLVQEIKSLLCRTFNLVSAYWTETDALNAKLLLEREADIKQRIAYLENPGHDDPDDTPMWEEDRVKFTIHTVPVAEPMTGSLRDAFEDLDNTYAGTLQKAIDLKNLENLKASETLIAP